MPRPGVASPAFVMDSRSRIPRRDPVGEVRDDPLFRLISPSVLIELRLIHFSSVESVFNLFFGLQIDLQANDFVSQLRIYA